MTRVNAVFLVAFVGVLIWITLFQPEAVAKIQRGAMVALRPLVKGSGAIESAVADLGTTPPSYEELRERLAEAELERDRLRLEVVQLDELLSENNELRRALQYLEKSPLSLAPARVISRRPAQWYNTAIIDKGSDDGVAVDSPVIVPLGDEAALVGKVSDVLGPRSAVVLLLTDEKCQVSAKLENSPEQGILSGPRGALGTQPELKLRYLSKDAVAPGGTRVFSSGAGELFPAKLLLGEILTLTPGVIDAEATVAPALNFDDLRDVFVILPPDPADEPAALPRAVPAGGADEGDASAPKPARNQGESDAGEGEALPPNPIQRP